MSFKFVVSRCLHFFILVWLQLYALEKHLQNALDTFRTGQGRSILLLGVGVAVPDC